VPVAMNCWVVPLAMLGLVGVIAMETNDAVVMVSVVDPEMLPDVALIVVEPAAIDVASPLDPAALLIVAAPVLEEFQVTKLVKSCVEPSEYVPVAVNCWVVPLAMLGLGGVIAMETSVAGVIVSMANPEMLPDVAWIVVEPLATDVASPFDTAALLIVAAPVLEELQVTAPVKSCVVPSE
jgi:hypothetical protein